MSVTRADGYADTYSVGYNEGYANGYRDALRQLKRAIDEKAALNDTAFPPNARRTNESGRSPQLTLPDASLAKDRRDTGTMLGEPGNGEAGTSITDIEADPE